MKTPEQIMTEFANEHSYDTWAELICDNPNYADIYTKDIMIKFADQTFKFSREFETFNKYLISFDKKNK